MSLFKIKTRNVKAKDSGSMNEIDTFVGFSNDENVMGTLKKEEKSLKVMIEQKRAVNTDLLYSSPSNVNHVKKRSKSIDSLPETSDVENNRSIRKKSKNNISLSPTNESVKTYVQKSLEITTPTLRNRQHSTSTPKSRQHFSTSQKMNVDINDPVYKLPFDHGWKRELVLRSNNAANIYGDVYYYSPNNLKLRSFKEVKKHLDKHTSDNTLTIDNFTFLKHPVGMNDRSKEIIRDAYQKKSFSINSKKPKTPAQSPKKRNISSNKMKVVFKKTTKPKKDKKSIITSSSTPKYTTKDCQPIPSIEASKIYSPFKTNNDIEANTSVIERRNAEINGSLNEKTVQTISMQSDLVIEALKHIFKYLNLHELITASRVCSAWNIAAMNKDLWENVRLKNSMVNNWHKFADTINNQYSVSLDTRCMLTPSDSLELNKFWSNFAAAIKKAIQLKVIKLYRCPSHVVEDTINSLSQIGVLHAKSIKNLNKAKDPVITLNLNHLGQMSNLTELKLKGFSGMKIISLPSFEKLVHLKTLSLTSIEAFPNNVNHSLQTVTKELKNFEIGDCDYLSGDFAKVLHRFENLKSLRLENCRDNFDKFARDIFCAIRNLKNLQVLELININIIGSVEDELGKCDGIKALLIIPRYFYQASTTNGRLIDCLKKLSETLTHLVWGLTNELISVTDLVVDQYPKIQHPIGYSLHLPSPIEPGNNIPIRRTRRQPPGEEDPLSSENNQGVIIDILSVTALNELLETMMINANTHVIHIPFSSTTRIHLAGHFKDL